MKKNNTYYRIEDNKGHGYPTALGKVWGTDKWNSSIDKAEKKLDEDLVVPEKGVKKSHKFAFTPSYVQSHKQDIDNLINESGKIGIDLKMKKVTIPRNKIIWGDKDQITYKGRKNNGK